MNLSDKLIDDIRTIGCRYDLEKIILYGSRARGDNKPRSDIDLAVFPGQELVREGRLAGEIDDLETLLKIDLVIVSNTTDPKLLSNIEKEGVVIYERS